MPKTVASTATTPTKTAVSAFNTPTKTMSPAVTKFAGLERKLMSFSQKSRAGSMSWPG